MSRQASLEMRYRRAEEDLEEACEAVRAWERATEVVTDRSWVMSASGRQHEAERVLNQVRAVVSVADETNRAVATKALAETAAYVRSFIGPSWKRNTATRDWFRAVRAIDRYLAALAPSVTAKLEAAKQGERAARVKRDALWELIVE